MSEFGLNKAAARAARAALKDKEARLPVPLNPPLPGTRTPFDWKFFGVQPPDYGMKKTKK